ncbi:Uncharacterized protein ChrSV_1467 [Chromobacterium vaccinii]|nr:Uncharacterized protein ChrSW_1467 [Chromobacterium vaccinii]QND88925.1 Uncharacterized protein ChrSV_1467 [Chromobacterium vaccinii]
MLAIIDPPGMAGKLHHIGAPPGPRHQIGSSPVIPAGWISQSGYDTMQQQRFRGWHASCLPGRTKIFTHLPLGARCLPGDKTWQ